MMPSTRSLAFCFFLFVATALITTSVRSARSQHAWPTLFQSRLQYAVTPTSKLAFATFLGSNTAHLADNDDSDDSDGYYLGTRILAYQLLHAPETRSNASIPFIVLTTKDVSKRKRARLTRDGATVVVVDKLNADWVKLGSDRWVDVLVKLRLFQLTAYDKICFIDADMLVTAPLAGVFDDPATDVVRTKSEPTALKDDEASLPTTYMFAGKGDAFGYDHAIPPAPSDYLNAGFYVFAPSQALFQYYVSLLRIPGRFDSGFPEQNLFNYAHRREGNIPWQTLSWRWNMNWPTMKDLQGGAKSFHAKYWDSDETHDPELKAVWRGQRKEMEGYYRGVDDVLEGRY